MEITVTLSDSTARLLELRVAPSGRPLEEVVSEAFLPGLRAWRPDGQPVVYPQPRNMGGARVDLTRALEILDAERDARFFGRPDDDDRHVS